MKHYSVSIDTCASLYVEADSVEEAREKACKEWDAMTPTEQANILNNSLEIGDCIVEDE
jgi:hypothetical protein